MLLVVVNLYGRDNPFRPSEVYLQEKYGMTSEQMDEYEYNKRQEKKQKAIHEEDDIPVLITKYRPGLIKRQKEQAKKKAEEKAKEEAMRNGLIESSSTNSNGAIIQASSKIDISTDSILKTHDIKDISIKKEEIVITTIPKKNVDQKDKPKKQEVKKTKQKGLEQITKIIKRHKSKKKATPTIYNQKTIASVIDVTIDNDILYIKSDYTIFKKFNLNKSKKIVIDFLRDSKRDFGTKTYKLGSDIFKSITIGNHKKYGYFRVVIKTTKAPSQYKTTYKNKTVKIRLKG